MVEKVLDYKSSGLWLDVGFGNGSLLFTAQEYSFQPVGLDLRKSNVEDLKMVSIRMGASISADYQDLVRGIEKGQDNERCFDRF